MIRFINRSAGLRRPSIESEMQLQSFFLLIASVSSLLCPLPWRFMSLLEVVLQCNSLILLLQKSCFLDYFQLWVFCRFFSIHVKMIRIVLTLRIRSAKIWKHAYIFSRSFFIVVMEKKFDFAVKVAHFQAGGQKSPL